MASAEGDAVSSGSTTVGDAVSSRYGGLFFCVARRSLILVAIGPPDDRAFLPIKFKQRLCEWFRQRLL
jgi:hypothetical protein